jgi:hypothetical protein
MFRKNLLLSKFETEMKLHELAKHNAIVFNAHDDHVHILPYEKRPDWFRGFNRYDFSGMKITGDLTRLICHDCNFADADFAMKTNAMNSAFYDCSFVSATWPSSTIKLTSFARCDFSQMVATTSRFDVCEFAGCSFIRGDFIQCRFINATFDGCSFIDVDFTFTTFAGIKNHGATPTTRVFAIDLSPFSAVIAGGYMVVGCQRHRLETWLKTGDEIAADYAADASFVAVVRAWFEAVVREYYPMIWDAVRGSTDE